MYLGRKNAVFSVSLHHVEKKHGGNIPFYLYCDAFTICKLQSPSSDKNRVLPFITANNHHTPLLTDSKGWTALFLTHIIYTQNLLFS